MHAQLKSLEQQLDELIRLTRNLRSENFSLQQKLVLSENQIQELEKKINRAASKIETILLKHNDQSSL